MLFVALVLLGLAAFNYAISRYVLYPPFVLSLLWATALVGLTVMGDFFYPVSNTTLTIFLVGTIAFSAGGFLASFIKLSPRRSPLPLAEIDKYLNFLIIAGLLGALFCLPLLWQEFRAVAGEGLSASLQQLRTDSMETALEPGGGVFNVVTTLTPILSVLAILSLFQFLNVGRGRLRTAMIILSATIYNLASTARSQVLLLLSGLICLTWLHSPRMARKVTAFSVIAFTILFATNQMQLEKVGAQADASLNENLPHLIEGAATYGLGGIVAFDETVKKPTLVPNNWKLYTYFIRTMNKVGTYVDEPPAFLAYVPISRDVVTNVYTIYFAYFSEYGLTGTIVLLFCIGFVGTYICREARMGSPLASVLLGPVMYGILMTVFAEAFFLEMGFWLKTIGIAGGIYLILPKLLALHYPATSRPT